MASNHQQADWVRRCEAPARIGPALLASNVPTLKPMAAYGPWPRSLGETNLVEGQATKVRSSPAEYVSRRKQQALDSASVFAGWRQTSHEPSGLVVGLLLYRS
jgi:hypothetical protein